MDIPMTSKCAHAWPIPAGAMDPSKRMTYFEVKCFLCGATQVNLGRYWRSILEPR